LPLPGDEIMNCEEFASLLADALGDELDPQDEPRFAQHVASCPRCCAEYQSARQTLGLLRQVAGPRRASIDAQSGKLIYHDVAGEKREASPGFKVATETNADGAATAVGGAQELAAAGGVVTAGGTSTAQARSASSSRTRFQGWMRYAAGLALAFLAGYAARTLEAPAGSWTDGEKPGITRLADSEPATDPGVPPREKMPDHGTPGVPNPDRTTADAHAPNATASVQEASVRAALAQVHQRSPRQSTLAKGLVAVFAGS
jgi:hypothetical protein